MEYKIGDFSRISRISIKTLRYYHEIGLLSPTRIDEESGYRFYDSELINTAYRINLLKDLSFSLKEIKNILDEYNDDEDLSQVMKNKLDETKLMIKKYQNIQKSIENIIPKETASNYDAAKSVSVKTVSEMLIASMRVKGQYGDVGYYLGRVSKQCARYICGNPFSMYYDADYVEEGADIEVCVPVSREVKTPDIKSSILKGGKFLSVYHKGPYEDIGNAYKKLLDYTYMKEINTSVPTREIYIKGPGVIFAGSPKRYLTEIQLQIDS